MQFEKIMILGLLCWLFLSCDYLAYAHIRNYSGGPILVEIYRQMQENNEQLIVEDGDNYIILELLNQHVTSDRLFIDSMIVTKSNDDSLVFYSPDQIFDQMISTSRFNYELQIK